MDAYTNQNHAGLGGPLYNGVDGKGLEGGIGGHPRIKYGSGLLEWQPLILWLLSMRVGMSFMGSTCAIVLNLVGR